MYLPVYRFPSALPNPKTIATLIIPPPKYSQALLRIVLTDVSPTCFTARPQTRLWDYRESVKNTRLFWTYIEFIRRLNYGTNACSKKRQVMLCPPPPETGA
jgi:hypothetical protein